MARLDRLGAAKEVAQVGAVIGSEFSYELLHAVHPLAEEDLQGALRKLADAELIYVHGIPPEANYRFKHALIRDAAYEALLKSRRKELHRLVARGMDEKSPALKEMHPEVLARHWTDAGEIEPAIAEWSRRARPRGRAVGFGKRNRVTSWLWLWSLFCPSRRSVTFANWTLGNQVALHYEGVRCT
jgi:predicted ATPase